MIVRAEIVKFKRPNSDKEEVGVMIGNFDRHIIIDNDLNIVINCSIEKYLNDDIIFNLNKYE